MVKREAVDNLSDLVYGSLSPGALVTIWPMNLVDKILL